MNEQNVLGKPRAPADLPGDATFRKGKLFNEKIKAEVDLNQSSPVQAACMHALVVLLQVLTRELSAVL